MGRYVYDLGEIAVLTVTFSVDGVATDPTTVTLYVEKPDGSLVEYDEGQLGHDGVGVFHMDVPADQSGDWAWRWVGTGSAADVDTGNFGVVPDPTVQNGRDLCSLLDVVSRVPGYEIGDDAETDSILGALITQESRDFVEACGREIIEKAAGPRTFDLTASIIDRRQLPIGDAAAVTQIELFDYDDATSLGIIAASLYVTVPRVRDDWEPIRRIWFPWRPGTTALLLAPGRTLHISAAWGFPKVPHTVTFAVATFVIFRYLNDIASAGTELADAANRPEFNLGASLRAAFDVRDRLNAGPFA